jgi:ABC-type amino acid transport system permease subunit
MTKTPSRIHSQMRLVPEPPEVAVTVVVAVGVAVAVGVGAAVGVAVAELAAVATLLVALPIALLTLLPHPVIRHPAARMATGRQTPLLVHRMLVLPHGQLGSRTSMIGRPHGPGLIRQRGLPSRRTSRAGTIPAG